MDAPERRARRRPGARVNETPTIIAAAGLGVTIAAGVLGVVYQMGRFAARLESLEAWRAQMLSEFNALHAGLRDIQALIRGENV